MTGLDGVLPAPQFAREAPSPPPPHHHSAFAEIEEAAEHEVHSLRELFRRRRLSVRTMERPLRLATGAALASLIGVIVLIALRDVDAGQTVIGRVSGVVNEVSTPLFVATLVFVSIGFAYVITGAILASWPLAVLALLVITGTIGYYTGAFGSLFGFSGFIELLPGWARWSARGLLMAIWVVAVAVMLFDRRFGRVGPTRKVRLTVLTIYAALFGGFFTVLAIGSPSIGGLNLFPESISLMMFEIVDLVTPILLVAAVDFGEWGGLTGERIAAAVKTKAPGLLTPVAVLASLGMLAYGYLKLDHHTALVSTTRLWSAGKALLLAAGGLVVILLVGRAVGAHRRRWPATLNFAALFAVCALLTYLIAPVSGVIAGQFKGVTTPIEQVTPEGEYTAAADVVSEHRGHGAAAFTILVPRGWLFKHGNGGVSLWLNAAVPGERPGTFVKHGLEQIGVLTASGTVDAAGVAGPAARGEQEREKGWTRVEVDENGAPGLLWARPAGQGKTTVVLEEVTGAPLARVRPLFEAVARSYRPAGAKPATLPAAEEGADENGAALNNDRLQSVSLAIEGGIVLLLLLVVGIFGRRWPPRVVGMMFMFGIVTFTTFLYFGDSIGRFVFGADSHWPFLGLTGLVTAVGVLSLVALAAVRFVAAARRRTLTVGLLGLQATIWALVGMNTLYGHALSASRIAVWAAVIVLIAIAWDVTMSGDSMTNNGSKHVPRATRVLVFMGYVVLVAATVMFYSAQRQVGTGSAAEPLFEPEAITQDGLFRIAFPLAVLMFLLRFAGRNRTGEPARPPVPLPPDAWTPPPPRPGPGRRHSAAAAGASSPR